MCSFKIDTKVADFADNKQVIRQMGEDTPVKESTDLLSEHGQESAV